MSTRQRRALLICNAKARNGALDLDEVRAILREGGIEPEEPSPEADCRDVIRDRAGAVDLVILGGGDGTMNYAAPALVEAGLPFAILPLGTANDLARSLNLPPTRWKTRPPRRPKRSTRCWANWRRPRWPMPSAKPPICRP